MKFTLVPFLVIFLLTACKDGEATNETNEEDQAEVNYCDCRDLAFDQAYNNFYLETPREGFTGLCEEFYANGNLSLSKNFTKGKVDGDLIEYYEDGSIKEKKTFEMNFQSGDHLLYNEAGELELHAVFDYGKQVEIVYPN